jgi:hypothetical protein
MNPVATRVRSYVIWTIVVLFAWVAAGCGATGQGDAGSADERDNQTTVSSISETASSLDGVVTTEPESTDTTLVENASVEGDSGLDAEEVFTMLVEGDGGDSEASPEGSDLMLGGSPDTSAAAGIVSGLEDAGVDLTGATVSVLPVSGMAVSLLVLELSDEYLETALPGPDEDDDMTGALLSLPEIESASIVEVVTIYRGEDEVGPFTMTFTVSVDDMRQAYESGSDLGDQLQVQLERAS